MERTTSVPVAGGQLRFVTRGAGPLLLLIAGGSGGGSFFTGMARFLAEHYSVVTYDRWGYGGTTLDDPDADMRIERHSEDAFALLTALTTEPAFVFGSSAGGLVALDLLSRYPQQVRLVVAHEPTVSGVLPAFDQAQQQHLATYQQAGAMVALAELGAENAGADGGREDDVELPPPDMASAALSAEVLFRSTVPALLRYRFDATALAAARQKLMLAGSRVGREHATPVYQCTTALAERLGLPVLDFPGNHVGCISHPRAFAARLHAVLSKPAGPDAASV
ncbi:MAG: alpha/beta hydrolase [Ktedonobacterales bacterium]|nr:alpha/beta hydrolase [Ktedonobacterales bacterium]